ncbi:MAG: hypothetical protein IJW51_04350 [Clostridia bacterium]|nr:hypothetical protein [Clostridia bacterium]
MEKMENLKKVLTFFLKDGNIYRLAQIGHTTASLLKNLKKTLKKFKKGIDKGKRLWYNQKVAAKEAAEMILEN